MDKKRSRLRPLLASVALTCAALTATQFVPVTEAEAAPAAFSTGGGDFLTQLFDRFFGGHGWLRWYQPPRRTTTAAPPTRPTTRSSVPTATPTTTTTTTTTAPAGGDPANPNPNCTIIVPRNPLSAAGLATPYRLRASDPRAGACHEANDAQSAFVEASIIDPATGALSVYHPLVVDDGTQPAIAPVVPALPRGAVVGVWFGYQADVLTLQVRHHRRGHMNVDFAGTPGCVNGTPGSPFGQYAYCNAVPFFAAANAAIKAGKLAIPALKTGNDGLACPTTRDFGIVDQDQSDNLPGKYLATADGRTAQFSAANQGKLAGATLLTNASDNGLVDNKLGPVLGCTPFTAPDLSQGGAPSPSLALNELVAAADQAAPVALVPPNDPMVLDANGHTSVVKTNLYRAGVDMPPLNVATETGQQYCDQMKKVGVARLTADQALTSAQPSPDPAFDSLFAFLVDRLTASWTNLKCVGDPPVVGGAPPAPAALVAATPTDTATVPPTTTTTAPVAPVAPVTTTPATPVPADTAVTPTDATGTPAVTG